MQYFPIRPLPDGFYDTELQSVLQAIRDNPQIYNDTRGRARLLARHLSKRTVNDRPLRREMSDMVRRVQQDITMESDERFHAVQVLSRKLRQLRESPVEPPPSENGKQSISLPNLHEIVMAANLSTRLQQRVLDCLDQPNSEERLRMLTVHQSYKLYPETVREAVEAMIAAFERERWSHEE